MSEFRWNSRAIPYPQCAASSQHRWQNNETHLARGRQTAVTAPAYPPMNRADESRNSISFRPRPQDAVETMTPVSLCTARPRLSQPLPSQMRSSVYWATDDNPARFHPARPPSDVWPVRATLAANPPALPSHSTDASQLRQARSEIPAPA